MAWAFLAVSLWRWPPANGAAHAVLRPFTRLLSSRLPAPFPPRTDPAQGMDRIEQARLLAAEDRLKQLEKHLALPESSHWRVIHATVTARDPLAWDTAFRIGKGKKHGVKKGAAVVSDGAVVGVVATVFQHSSQVRTLLAADSRLGVKTAGSGNVGILKGQDKERTLCLIDYLDRDRPCVIGEDVITSGLSDTVPGGLPVGSLVPWNDQEVTHVVNSTYARGRVRVAAIRGDFRYVRVITTAAGPEE
ncbi:MAG: rod shape-determining protein MreC [Lentisphaeria bacterium]|nr:rod shape-determining protein MreC [Lentisphaeria bacterium]